MWMTDYIREIDGDSIEQLSRLRGVGPVVVQTSGARDAK